VNQEKLYNPNLVRIAHKEENTSTKRNAKRRKDFKMIKVKLEYSEIYKTISVIEIKGIRNAAEWLTRTLEKYACFSCAGALMIDWATLAQLPKDHNDYIPFDLKRRIVLVS
jgi:hypothetical protein